MKKSPTIFQYITVKLYDGITAIESAPGKGCQVTVSIKFKDTR